MRLLSVNQVSYFYQKLYEDTIKTLRQCVFPYLSYSVKIKAERAPLSYRQLKKPGQVRTCLGQVVTSPHASQSPEPRAACSSGPRGCDRANHQHRSADA